MAKTRSPKNGRLAAMLAADRIKLLLEYVEEDDFLREILSTADLMVEDSMSGLVPSRSRPRGRAQQYTSSSAESVLDENYHEAKKKSVEKLDPVGFRFN